MTAAPPAGYSKTQIWLHWIVVLLMLFQMVAHEAMETAAEAQFRGFALPPDTLTGAYAHIAVGFVIFVLAAWRLALRFTRGAPPLPASEPRILKLLATLTHIGLYAIMLGMPISGAIAWFGRTEVAGAAHQAAFSLFLLLFLLHVAGALAQQFWFKTDVLKRMIRSR